MELVIACLLALLSSGGACSGTLLWNIRRESEVALATKLAEPLPTTDGGVLRTIGNLVVYMKALAKRREQVAKLIFSRASAKSIQPRLSLGRRSDQ